MTAATRPALVGCFAAVGVFGGCTAAPSGRDVPALAPQSAKSEAPRGETAALSTGGVRPGPTRRETVTPVGRKEAVAFHRLVLLSGSAAEGGDAMPDANDTEPETVIVRRATARQVGQLIAELYPPVGPGGTEHRFYLIYQTPQELQAAARLVARMDVDAEGIATDGELPPTEAFATAIPLYYELSRLRTDARLAEELIARFEYAASDEEVPAQLRWASAMIAARLQVDQSADPAAQKRDLLLASVAVSSDSLESFLAQAALVEWYEENDRPEDAADLARELAVRFDIFEDTFVYQECLRRGQRAGR